MKSIRQTIAAVEAFAMYLLTGAACVVIGSGLNDLMRHFNAELVAVTALGSAFALGRVSTVFFTGWVTEKIGPKIALGAGLAMLLSFLGGLTVVTSIPAAMVCAALGGVGMGVQDAVCPEILTRVFPQSYASALNTGQACFGAGCFLPPLVMSFVLARGAPFYYTYYVFAALCVVMLLLLPAMKLQNEGKNHKAGGARVGKGVFAKNGAQNAFTIWLLFGVMCVFYCAVTNTINLYAASYAMSKGLVESHAVNILTLYNVGCMTGSLLFAAVVRYVKPATLICLNLLGSVVFLCLALATGSFWGLAIVFFLAGTLLGVVFSLMVTLAVGISSGSASRAGAIVAVMTGAADFLAPVITGALITATSINAGVWFSIACTAVSLAAAVAFRQKRRSAAAAM